MRWLNDPKLVGLCLHSGFGRKHETTPAEYLSWARKKAAELSLHFAGTPEQIQAMIDTGSAHEGDVFIDYGVTGDKLSRAGLDDMSALLCPTNPYRTF